MEFVIKSILPLPFEYCEYKDGIKLKDLCNLYKEFCSKPDRWFLCDAHAKCMTTELCKWTEELFCWRIPILPVLLNCPQIDVDGDYDLWGKSGLGLTVTTSSSVYIGSTFLGVGCLLLNQHWQSLVTSAFGR